MIRFLRLLAVGLPAVLLIALLAAAPARASATASEHTVRAALLFNFLKFTHWPEGALNNLHLQLCIASDNAELLAAMEKLNARQVQGRSLLVTRYSPQAVCDALFVDGQQRWMGLPDLAAAVLTVGDYRGFAAAGGMIEISLYEGEPSFDINLAVARRAGLRFYPQMLKLARRVIE